MIIESSTYLYREDLAEVVQQMPGFFEPIADLLFPGRPVTKTKGQMSVIEQHNYTEDVGEDTIRKAELAEAKEVNARYGELTYAAIDRSLKHTIPYRKMADMGDRVRLEAEGAHFLEWKFKLRRELRVAALMADLARWPIAGFTGFQAPVSWYAAGGKPKTDVELAQQYLAIRGGNRVKSEGWMSVNTFARLLLLEDLVNDRRYIETPSLLVTDANKKAVAAQLGLESIFVGNVIYNTKAEGAPKLLAMGWPDEYIGIGNYSATFGSYRVGTTYYNTATKGMGIFESWDNKDVEGVVLRRGDDLCEEVHHTDMQTLVRVKF